MYSQSRFFLIFIFAFGMLNDAAAQCIAPGTCAGTEMASSGNVTIPAGTTYKISVGNSSSANVTFATATSVLCIGGTFTGTINGNPPAGATINCYGTINSNNDWDFSGGGLTTHVTEGASMTIKRYKISSGTHTITNCGNITFSSATAGIYASGGTFTINNYASINVTTNTDCSAAGFTFNNYTGSQLYVGGNADFSSGTFLNQGQQCVKGTTHFSAGTFTNSGCYRSTDWDISGNGAFSNTGSLTVVGNYSNSGGNNSNSGRLTITGNFHNSGTNFINNGIITIAGDFDNSGSSFTLGPGSGIYCSGWDNSGSIKGPASSCALMRATGYTHNSATWVALNSGNIDFYDTGNPAADGTPAIKMDSNSGDVKSAANTGTCSPSAVGAACAMAGSTCVTVMPVELLVFTGKLQEKEILLSWKTATEINNDYFVVERSADAQTFKAIGNLPGAGNSTVTINYDLLDGAPLNGVNYYRLKQTDYDGQYKYSRIIAIDINSQQDLKLLYLFTDQNQQLQYQISAIENNAIAVDVLDVLGKKVLSDRIGYDEDHDQQFKLDAAVLNKGVYFFRISDGKTTVVKKFVN